MPRTKGFTQASIKRNIKAEGRAGRSRKQAIAIALSTARKAASESDSPEAKRTLRRLSLRKIANR